MASPIPGPWIDTHAHLDDGRFRDDLPAVLERAQATGLEHIITVATTRADTLENIDLAKKHPQLSPTAGIHPNNIHEAAAGDWDEILQHADNPLVKAIGETGLDRYWKDTPFDRQEDYFARHLALSRAKYLPIVIHCRDADADVRRMLEDDFNRHGPILGVMHSFAGDQSLAEACVAMGLYISFSGMFTYKGNQKLRDLAPSLPLDRLLVETDSPYLTPMPFRGQRNEPAHVQHTGARLAEVLGLPIEQVAQATTQNAITLFQLR